MPVIESKLSPVTIPEGVSLYHFLMNRFKHHEDKVAFIDGVTGREYTYREVKSLVTNVAGALYHVYGVRKGDVLCTCMFNCVEYALIAYALLSIGAILTPCNPMYTPGELKTQLLDSGAKFILTRPETVPTVREACKAVPIRNFFVVGQAPGFVSFETLVNYNGPAAPAVPIDPTSDLAYVPYSSGTTGKQKGVMLTHRNLIANCCQACHPDLEMSTSADTMVWTLPMYHIYGLSTVFSFIPHKGGTTVILPRFHLEEYLRAIQKYKATFLFIVPPIALQLARSPLVERFDLSTVRMLWCGAAPLGKDLQAELAKRFKSVPVKQGYGMTECSPQILFPPVRNWKTGSAGMLAPNTRCKIRDIDTDTALGPHKEGELCIQGPQVMKGYLGNPIATSQTIDKDGWLHTGDIVYYDDEQNFFVVDRLKELIKYKGFQVAPAELESLLLTHPSVLDVAVIGQPDYEAGELPIAFVVRKQGKEVTDRELVSFVQARVAPHKRLRGGAVFVTEIPKSAAGKILRRALRDQLKTKQTSKL